MKRIFLSAILLFATGVLLAQKPITVSGSIDKKGVKEVKLFKAVEGEAVSIATSKVNEDGQFGFLFYPKVAEGFYAVGYGDNRSPANNYTFYLKPGDHLSFAVKDNGPELVGNENTAQNKIMAEWARLAAPLAAKSLYLGNISTYEDFFPQIDSMTPALNGFINKVHTNDPVFNQMGPFYMKADLQLIAINFLFTPRVKHPDDDVVKPAIYRNFKIEPFTTTADIFKLPYGSRILNSMIQYEIMPYLRQSKGAPDPEEFAAQQLKYVSNDTLRGAVMMNRILGARSYIDFLDLYDEFGDYLVTDVQQQKVIDHQNGLADFKPGTPGFKFSYPDTSGKMYSLADFKGKVVLIDMWATWCIPCREEIPYLKTLESEMKGKDVAVVSISVDEQEDEGKWKKFVADEHLQGYQLFASGWSDITKFYQIKGIPRFMLFDKDGNLITHDAPRPSSPKLKELIERYL